jgi:hypothetical protein
VGWVEETVVVEAATASPLGWSWVGCCHRHRRRPPGSGDGEGQGRRLAREAEAGRLAQERHGARVEKGSARAQEMRK